MARFMGVPGSTAASRLHKGYLLLVVLSGLQDVLGAEPLTCCLFAEVPGVALPAGEVTPRLVNGEIIFRSRKVHAGNHPLPRTISETQSSLTAQPALVSSCHKAFSRTIALLHQVTGFLIWNSFVHIFVNSFS